MRTFLLISSIVILSACDEESYIPKPPTYLRLELPDHKYERYTDACNYTFDIASIFEVNPSYFHLPLIDCLPYS